MTDEWYVARRGQDGNKRYGPVPLRQLRELLDAGRVQPDDLVWREGMPQWQRADECDDLRRPAAPGRRDHGYGPEPRDYPPRYGDRRYRRPYRQPQSSSAWAIPLVVVGGVLAMTFLSCGGLVLAGVLSAAANRPSYSPGYTSPVVEPDPPIFQDPNPPVFVPPDPNPPVDVNPPVFVPPDPNPPIFVPPDPNPPIFVPPP